MKKILLITRILVGVLFIFSGLIKANDPHGLGYKMEEFFEVWNEGLSQGSFFLNKILVSLFSFFHEHALLLAVVMIALEIIAGFALIIGWHMRFFSWLLLLMIVFFTFLTGYAWLATKPDGSPRFTNCGCFGDCIPITPDISFTKDVILTVLIVLLFIFRKKIEPVFSKRPSLLAMLAVTVFSFAVQWYSLNYLPMMDCLPFKKGNNISEQMKMPANAVPEVKEIIFIYEKNGKQVEFSATQFPADFDDSYKYIDKKEKIIRKGKNNRPPVEVFQLTGFSGTDSAQFVLSNNYAILLFAQDFSTPVKEWNAAFEKLNKQANEKNIPVYMITARQNDAPAQIKGTGFADIPVFSCDVTTIKMAARSNPTVFVLEKGTILGKWSGRQIHKAETMIKRFSVQPVTTVPDPVAPDSSQIVIDTLQKNDSPQKQ